MIYLFSKDLKLISQYATVQEAGEFLSIPRNTINSSITKKGLCRGKYYFRREPVIIMPERTQGPVPGKKFTVVVTKEIWDDLLVTIGQRNKQDIFRKLLKNWIKSENDKHRVSAGY